LDGFLVLLFEFGVVGEHDFGIYFGTAVDAEVVVVWGRDEDSKN
jgi:hypothetical protein